MRPLRFLHVFGTFDHGGAEARTLELMRGFGGRAAHVVLVADQSALGARSAIAPGVQASFPVDPSRMVSGHPLPPRLLRLARLMRGYDLVLTYGWGAMDVVLAHRLLSRPMRLPKLVHHEDGIDPPRRGAGRWLRRAYRRFALRGADRIVVPSQSLLAIALAEWRLPARRLACIPNGVKMDGDDGSAATGAATSRDRPGQIQIVAVAGLRPEKNLPRLVRTAAQAGDDIRLAILGEGPERAAIVAEARMRGFEDRLDLCGFVPNVGDYLNAADIFALSSDTEQCPLSLIEAMAAGLPVVAPRVGDIESMVAEANRPFIVPHADEARFAAAIRTLADDPAMRREIGRANAEHARRHHSSAPMIDTYFQLYAGLSGSRPAAS